MFEKEAEEYIMRKDVITENDRVPFDNGYGFQTVSFEDEVKKAFKDGVEFGYNKANEWHYVKDGDLPKEDCLVYYKDAMGNFSFSFIHPSYYIAGVESFFKANPQIIAWKEIVLPKEIKEND